MSQELTDMDDVVQQTRKLWIQSNADEVKDWPIMMHPATFIALVAFYVSTLTLGPKLMANRRPFELRLPMIVYNTLQMGFNAFLVFEYFRILGFKGLTFFGNVCSPTLHNDPSDYAYVRKLTFAMILYYVNKVLDLTETVFFVLRKKHSQITSLHVFHHLSMLISAYLCLVCTPEEISVVMGALNAGVHFVMYAYYFLAVFGPEIQKYLWWKQYITRLQMTQFVIMLACLFKMAVDRCDTSLIFWSIWVLNVSSFFIMFYQFYSKSYAKAK